MNFISQRHELTENEEFFELPISLQAEIFDSVWTQPTGAQSDMLDYGLEHLLPTSSASSNSFHCPSPGVNDLKNAVETMLLTPELDVSEVFLIGDGNKFVNEHAKYIRNFFISCGKL